MNERRISFCIPAHNEESTLSRAVQSILDSEAWKQAIVKEILICINGSTDRSWEVAKEIEGKIPSVRCFNLEKASKGAAWNSLILECSPATDFVAFLDADVATENDTFTKLIAHLESNSGIDLIGARTTPAVRKYPFIQGLFAEFLRHKVMTNRHLKGQYVPGCCYVLRKSATGDIKLPEEAAAGDDLALNSIFHSRKYLLENAIVYFVPPDFGDRIKVCIRYTRTLHLFRNRYPHLLNGIRISNAGPNKDGLIWDFMQLPFKLKIAALINHLAVSLGIIWAKISLRWFDPSKPWGQPNSTKLPIP